MSQRTVPPDWTESDTSYYLLLVVSCTHNMQADRTVTAVMYGTASSCALIWRPTHSWWLQCWPSSRCLAIHAQKTTCIHTCIDTGTLSRPHTCSQCHISNMSACIHISVITVTSVWRLFSFSPSIKFLSLFSLPISVPLWQGPSLSPLSFSHVVALSLSFSLLRVLTCSLAPTISSTHSFPEFLNTHSQSYFTLSRSTLQG